MEAEVKGRYKGDYSPVFHKHLGSLFKMLVTRPHLSPAKSEYLKEEFLNLNSNKVL